MSGPFLIDFRETPFLETSKTAADAHRLNWRAHLLLTRNQSAIEGKTVLDIASHDGRFSYACLKLGAKHVTGVEARSHLKEAATTNLENLGYGKDRFTFIQNDIFNYLDNLEPRTFDTVLCFGFFYHTVKQNTLLEHITRIQTKRFLLDTHIARGIYASRPLGLQHAVKGDSPKATGRAPARRSPAVALRRFASFLDETRTLVGQALIPGRMKPCLVFRREDHTIEGATIDPSNLVAWPNQKYIEAMFREYGFEFRQLRWTRNEVDDWTNLEDYRRRERVSYLATAKDALHDGS